MEVSLGVELYNTLMKLEHVFENIDKALDYILTEESYALSNSKDRISAQGGLSVAGRCRCLTKDSNTSIEKEGYIPYSLQA